MKAAIAYALQQYTANLRTMLTELRQVYEGSIAAKDEALGAKDQVIATQGETIAELRRRAEAAEAETQPLRDKVAQVP